jgi:hypothetical protein
MGGGYLLVVALFVIPGRYQAIVDESLKARCLSRTVPVWSLFDFFVAWCRHAEI